MEDKKIAQYKKIEQDLLEQISMGYYKIDSLIPTELELSKTYQVSRVTVRKATDNLVAKGLLYRTSGVGTFVRKMPVKQKPSALNSFTNEMKELGLTPTTRVDVFMIKKAPSHISHILNLKEDEMVYYIERKRYANEELFVIETTHMSTRLYPDLSIQVLENSKYEYFEKIKKLKIDYSHHTVTPVHPSAKAAGLFGISQTTPIIKIANITYLENGQIMDYTELLMNSPKYQLNYIRC